jgi:signal transduction histidine kinase
MSPAPLAPDSTRPGFWPGFFAALTGRSVGWAVALAIAVALVIAPVFHPPLPVLFGRTLFIAIVLLLAFTAAGQWRRAPLPRWVVQLIAVGLAAPIATLAVYLLSTGGDWQALFGNEARVTGFVMIGSSALLLGLVLALGSLYRERDAQANAQALQFALERETLERLAADAQLKVLQSQIEPHFLFNTLANVQALVESGSPRAAPVLGSLIAYLRAALPQLHRGAPTLGQEEALVRSYLELMQMRLPDRLAFSIDIDPALHALRLPPLTLLTLVENAVRHGIDPSEGGGHIEVGARRNADSAVTLWVQDSGRGIDVSQAPGTGLASLRERLLASHGRAATLVLQDVQPHGVRAEITLPADPRLPDERAGAVVEPAGAYREAPPARTTSASGQPAELRPPLGATQRPPYSVNERLP